MNPRTLVILAAVLLIAGFAAADTLRSRAGEPAAETSEAETTTGAPPPSRRVGPRPQAQAPAGWPTGELQGTLVFTDARDCRVRVIGLAGGRERPLPLIGGSCDLWPAPRGSRIAYGLGELSGDTVPFRFLDLSRPNRDLGGYRALFGFVTWSPDGRRAAWCGRSRTGFDLDVGGPARRLRDCPVAYTQTGRIAFAVGPRLLVENRSVLEVEDGGITSAHFAADGAVVVGVDGRRLERWSLGARAPESVVRLPGDAQGRTPILSPDGCSAAFRVDAGIRVVELGCGGTVTSRTFPGADATWSPDGSRLAIAEPESIAFYPAGGFGEPIRWPASAARLGWRP